MRDDGSPKNHEDDSDFYEVDSDTLYTVEGTRFGVAAGLPAIPPAVSRLQSLRSLRLPQHEALRKLPPELFTLSR